MKDNRYIEIFSNPAKVPLAEIPVLDYQDFRDFISLLMGEEGTHCVAYFVLPSDQKFRFICCMAADENHAVVLFSHEQPRQPLPVIQSLTVNHYQFHAFEREIHEQFGIMFEGHPWLKPVRYPFDRFDPTARIENYPFFNIAGEGLHEVGVGPVHAGIIEPGYFRFICHGENVLHLEIQLGYQHRGVESLFVQNPGILKHAILSESIAGDTTIGHSLAYSGLVECLSSTRVSRALELERVVALELERIAIHIGDTAALCTDIAYQFGQVVNEALRTIVINTTQLWCGNRFGKGMIRPGGTNYPLTDELVKTILKNLDEVYSRYQQIADRIFSLPSALGRFENTGTITPRQATLIGAVGMAARASGMYRDIRWSHPFAAFRKVPYFPVMSEKGDVLARALLRKTEIGKSIEMIREILGKREKGRGYASIASMDSTPDPQIGPEIKQGMTNDERRNEIPSQQSDELNRQESSGSEKPLYNLRFSGESLAISLVEGWRGEICHVAVTDSEGKICLYKVKDPSLHNWLALALAVRNQEISDFPLCNKSFNLSYCGHDL